MAEPAARATRRSEGVQSLARAFELLEHMADAGGDIGITRLAQVSGLPLPTIYRLLRTLVAGGYARQGASRRYGLGPRLIRLGEGAGMALGAHAKPQLVALAAATGETANLAVLDGDEAVYVAQAPSRHAVRMFTEVGRRVHPHCTGVGKALLAQLPDDQALAILRRTGLPALTPATVTDLERLADQLAAIRRLGYAVDEGEQEVGVVCFAVPVPTDPPRAALSVSGPAGRMGEDARRRAIPLMRDAARRVAGAADADATTS
ncbi:MAG TPA: IclR family transcriptional regulator [Acidimicrobiales bacterium]|nr:IclR family transcriptional regulator [Acidimicrobiales bacterium]